MTLEKFFGTPTSQYAYDLEAQRVVIEQAQDSQQITAVPHRLRRKEEITEWNLKWWVLNRQIVLNSADGNEQVYNSLERDDRFVVVMAADQSEYFTFGQKLRAIALVLVG